ncbi:uncharacterized protein SPSK_10201 [Sporothrix schenckii 1099-18]|uniref:Uncharacterized protein n=1 Tax=Sporothrix schenckii 1099-18 TaxID=1397361 RepID=A0A0F2M7J2_SPOSC|nr:uncharacterized protein SPSK_10201 [Sporothrix schenckii 1099-18]KJR85039.1 hypothetical protein SPSK_10201 [Sporothrix schenckii 1099-18]
MRSGSSTLVMLYARPTSTTIRYLLSALAHFLITASVVVASSVLSASSSYLLNPNQPFLRKYFSNRRTPSTTSPPK